MYILAPHFQEFLQELARQEVFSIDTETTHINPVQAELVGLSFSWANRQAVYLPVGHTPAAAPDGRRRAAKKRRERRIPTIMGPKGGRGQGLKGKAI